MSSPARSVGVAAFPCAVTLAWPLPRRMLRGSGLAAGDGVAVAAGAVAGSSTPRYCARAAAAITPRRLRTEATTRGGALSVTLATTEPGQNSMIAASTASLPTPAFARAPRRLAARMWREKVA